MGKQITAVFPETFEAVDGETLFEVAAASSEGDDKKIPTFELTAYRGGPMVVSEWMDPVVLDLAGLKARSQQVPVRLGHDSRRMVGHTTTVTVSADKVTASGVASFENGHAREVVSSARNGFKWQVSLGVAGIKDGDIQRLGAKESAVVNGRTVTGPLSIVRAGFIKEISFVDLGADSTTSAKVAAQQTKGNKMAKKDGEEETESETTETETTSGNKPRTITASGDTSTGGVINAARTERGRRERILVLIEEAIKAPGSDLDALESIGQKAITAGWDEQKTELEIMRAGRATGAPVLHVRSEMPMKDEVLAAAVLLSLGAKHDDLVKDPDFGERAVEAAWKHRSITLHGLIATALKAEGIQAPHGGQALFRAAMEHSLKAGFSTVNLPGVLGTVGNKLLLKSFTAVNAIYPRIAQQSEFNNFLTYTQYRLNDVGAFAQVGKDGELKHGSLTEDSYTNKLETRGQMLTLTRQDIINDDLGALQQLYGILGRKAALAVERAAIDAILEGSDVFFSSAHGNKQTTAALSIATLGAAEALMAAQLDADSEPIYAAPKILLVPPGLKFLAEQIFTSAALVGGSTAGPEDNPFRGRFQVESSPYLALAALSGSHASTWYLLADPENLPVIQVAYLRGGRQPTIETADSTFNTLGMQMRCYFDFGVAQVDYRGGVKSVA